MYIYIFIHYSMYEHIHMYICIYTYTYTCQTYCLLMLLISLHEILHWWTPHGLGLPPEGCHALGACGGRAFSWRWYPGGIHSSRRLPAGNYLGPKGIHNNYGCVYIIPYIYIWHNIQIYNNVQCVFKCVSDVVAKCLTAFYLLRTG